MVLLQKQAVIVQKPAGAGGSQIKQKQACLNLYLLYLLYDENECVHRLLISMPRSSHILCKHRLPQ